MPLDLSTLPISGGVIVGVALYAGASLIAGQVMGERMIAKSGWYTACEDGLKAAALPERPPRQIIEPKRCSDVATLLGPFMGDAFRLCAEFGDPVINGAEVRAEEAARKTQEAIDAALAARAAERAPSQCACAASDFRRERIWALGAYAGTARQITWDSVEALELGLLQSLGTPSCQALGPGA